MADFDNVNPPKVQTDPDGLGAETQYPRHMHAADGSYLVVNNDDEKQVALDAGYTLEPTNACWTDWGKKPAPSVKPAAKVTPVAKAKR